MTMVRVLWVLAVAIFLPAAAVAQGVPVAPGPDGKLVVYVANGAGASTSLSDGLGTAAKQAGLPMYMKTVFWSRQGSAMRDRADHASQLAAAQALAQEVLTLKAQCPTTRIFLMGHSAGCRVIL